MTEFMQSASVRLATAMNRRRFIRRAATGTFAGIASLAAGKLINPSRAFAYTQLCEGTTGPGCPYGCGPSWACSVQSGGCHCSDGAGGCQNGTINCQGDYNDWGAGVNCWTCTYTSCEARELYRFSTTCCDCATTYCDKDHRCIAYKTTSTYLGLCGAAASEPGAASQTSLEPGQIAGVATGDPSTSWGVQPRLAPVPPNASPPY